MLYAAIDGERPICAVRSCCSEPRQTTPQYRDRRMLDGYPGLDVLALETSVKSRSAGTRGSGLVQVKSARTS